MLCFMMEMMYAILYDGDDVCYMMEMMYAI
jgi:hypothetical protein